MSRIFAFSFLSLVLCLLLVAGVAAQTREKTSKPAAASPQAKAAVLTGPWWQNDAAAADPLDAVFGPDARLRWDVPDAGFTLERDPLLGRDVLTAGTAALTLSSRASYTAVDATALLRLVTDAARPNASAVLTLTDPDPQKPGLPIVLTGAFNGNFTASAAGANATYDLRAYDTILPTWPAAVRAPIERDMATLPMSQDKWVRLRVQLNGKSLRVWVDDRLLVNKADNTLVRAGLTLSLPPAGRLASLRLRTVAGNGLFEPIALDGYVRDRALLNGTAVADDALPFGKQVTVGGVPVRFADRGAGADHLDVGRSLVRQGQLDGYFPTYEVRYSGCWAVDPARIQLRIPNARYDALYLVAGFDGGKDRIPQLTAMFYRPSAGYAQCFEGQVPAVTATAAQATPLPVTLENGKTVNLWLVKIPLDPAKLTSFADLDTVEVELTKRVHQYRSYPDPYLYGWHGAGLPSGVQVYAVTLHKPEVELKLDPAVFGHVWTSPQTPAYNVTLTNNTGADRAVTLAVKSTSYDGTDTTAIERPVTLKPGQTLTTNFNFAVKKNGIHRIDVTLKDGTASWTETRNACRLAADTRAPYWKEGDGPLFGFWTYGAGHYGPPGLEVYRVMKLAGARTTIAATADPKTPEGKFLIDNKWPLAGNAWPIGPQWGWAGDEPLDMAKYTAFKDTALKAFRDVQGDNPDYVTFFPEPGISNELTNSIPADYYGEPYKTTPDEDKAIRVFMNTSKAAAESIRAAWPKTKILIPWGDPLFSVALLRAGYPANLIDGSALDMIGFERLPEQQMHQQSTHRLYVLRHEFEKAGVKNPQFYYNEGVFSPTEAGALTWQEQAERYHRWTLISLAYGIERFYSGWFAFDCGDYYGAEHYGGCGIQRRIPYLDPKPAYAHYATMTRMLERAKFDKWLPTGSHTVYCLKFTKLGQPVYALWTVRGTRPATLSVAKDITVTDSMDNGTPAKAENGKATITIGTSPIYVTGAEITAIALGTSDHADAITWSRTRNQDTWHDGPAVKTPPIQAEKVIANPGDGSWTNVAEHDAIYETNNFDTKRFLGKMTTRVTADDERKGNFLAVHLEPQDTVRQLMPWYTVLKPKAPVEIPGKADALGIWVKAHSDWGRVVYCLRDAKGERWISIGTKDQWNCDDVHSWSAFCFDGWRYLRVELPANAEFDAFREYGSTGWGNYKGDNIVDLPLTLDKVIVERRTHVMYVNDPQPADPSDVLLGEITAEYATPADATKQAVTLNRLRMPLPPTTGLPNPIAEMTANPLPPVTLQGIKMPDWGYDGTSCHVNFSETADAAGYQVWVAAYPDGRGAVALGNMAKSGGQIYQLRPAIKLYLWVTYKDKAGKQSKPSNRLDIELVDAFANK